MEYFTDNKYEKQDYKVDPLPKGEYEECQTKAVVVTQSRPNFDLLESLLYEDGVFFLLEGHIARLQSSAEYFDYQFDASRIKEDLITHSKALNSKQVYKVRLLLDKAGRCSIESEPIKKIGLWRLGMAHKPVNEKSRLEINRI